MISKALTCISGPSCSAYRSKPKAHGHYFRKSDQALVQRYRCSSCRRTFSEASFSQCYRQKKRHLNSIIFKLLAGGYSQRRAAFDLAVNRKTIVRKFLLMGQESLISLPIYNLHRPKVKIMEFDDLETFEHTKCKPLSVTLAVEYKTRRILGFKVAQMPAKGRLAKISRAKYGPRQDQRQLARASLFQELQALLTEDAVIKSDQNPHYEADVAKLFAGHRHQSFKGRKPASMGQGELKKGGFDPLFSLNHTCAMLRANINRLFRRTWCTTKRKDRLSLHIAIYALNHNLRLI